MLGQILPSSGSMVKFVKATKQWRKLDRQSPCWMLAFAVPSNAALAMVARYGPIVEMGCGTGYWASLLRERGVQAAPPLPLVLGVAAMPLRPSAECLVSPLGLRAL